MNNLDSILKNRDITLSTKVYIVRAMVFPVVMYRCESWIIKKAKHQRIDAFKLWCWRRLLRVPWTERRSNQSILNKSTLNTHWKDWCWSWSSNTLATWCEEPTNWKTPCSWEREKIGGVGDDRGQMVGAYHWLNGHDLEQAPGDGEVPGSLACCRLWCHKESDETAWMNNNNKTECLKNYGKWSIILYMRQWTKPSQRKRDSRRQSGCLGRLYK